MKTDYHCHACDRGFSASVENEHCTYEFRYCPRCGSAKTTLSTHRSGQNGR